VLKIPWENFRNPYALARFFLTAMIGLALDLWSKSAAFATLANLHSKPTGGYDFEPIRSIDFIPGWVHFEVTLNPGAVFGIGQGKIIIFKIVSVVAFLFLTGLFACSGKRRFNQFIFGLLMAGVLGNLYDRIVYSGVRDMIRVLPQWPNLFPWIFNVADMFLCTGVFLLLVASLPMFQDKPDASHEPS
jgi:signal peptidase II